MQIRTKSPRNITLLGRVTAAMVLSLLVGLSTYPGVHTAHATGSTCSSISDCSNKIAQNNNAVNDLKGQAANYQDAISNLSTQIGAIQGSIADSKARQTTLEGQIADAQKQIDSQKALLAEDLRTMYIDGQMSTIEALATSNSLSDYVDKEEYRNSVQDALQTSLNKIASLQKQLQDQRSQVSDLLQQQQQQAANLHSDQQQQASLLNYNQSQQAAYNAETKANQSKLNALIAAQRNANNSSKGGYYFLHFNTTRVLNSSNDGGYTYANAGFNMSTLPGCGHVGPPYGQADSYDAWGYCTRQCVSYVAWAIQKAGGTAPTGWGNAKNWVAAARSSGKASISNVPQPGDIAISTSGTWGHAMYVEQVSGRKIYVAQYNQQLTGQFSHQWRQWE